MSSQIRNKTIGERITFSKNKQALHIEITQQVDRLKETLLLAWLAAWTFCGAVFVYFMLISADENERIMLGIMLALWSFFEFRVARVFLWRKFGREVIHMEGGELTIENRFFKRGKVQRFNLQHVKKFGPASEKATSFFAQLDNSFWVMGGERFVFSFMGREYQFGKQLDAKEIRSLGPVLDKGIREYSKSN